jgi:hypothetical protein
MRFGRGRWHWYDIIIVGLAAVIVYPDKIMEWLSECTGWKLGWLQLILIEVVAIVLMVIAMALLMPAYPKLEWWYPMLFVGLLIAFRAVSWLINQMFGFDD